MPRRQLSDDTSQARAEHARGERLRMAPGAPRWKRVDSAAELDERLVGAHRVDGADVISVEPVRGSDGTGVVVTLRDGVRPRYRSPDRRLGTLLAPFATDPADGQLGADPT